MFGEWSEIFNYYLIPWPERNLIQYIEEEWAIFVWMYNIEWIFGYVNIEEKRFWDCKDPEETNFCKRSWFGQYSENK